MNRLTRDQILTRALDMIDSPSLDAKDRPTGTIEGDALSLSWLQDGLDYFHHEFPWQGVVKSASVTLGPSGSVTLPSDFILDVRDGVVTARGRLTRVGLQEFIDTTVVRGGAGEPYIYVISGDVVKFHQVPAQDVAGTLWYYSLPAELGPATRPAFPVDWVLVEFVHLRGREWLRQLPANTAHGYAKEKCKELKSSGLAGEPERTRIPFDPQTWRPTATDAGGASWMGEAIAR